jgi:hypothetical protein
MARMSQAEPVLSEKWRDELQARGEVGLHGRYVERMQRW